MTDLRTELTDDYQLICRTAMQMQTKDLISLSADLEADIHQAWNEHGPQAVLDGPESETARAIDKDNCRREVARSIIDTELMARQMADEVWDEHLHDSFETEYLIRQTEHLAEHANAPETAYPSDRIDREVYRLMSQTISHRREREAAGDMPHKAFDPYD